MRLSKQAWITLSLSLLVILIVTCSLGTWSNVVIVSPSKSVVLPPPYRGYLLVASSLMGDGGFRVAGKVFIGAEGIPKAIYVSPSPLPYRGVKLSSETPILVYVSSTGPYMIIVVSLVVAGAALLIDYKRRRQIVGLLALLTMALSVAAVAYSWYYWRTPSFAEAHTLLSASYKYLLEPGDYKVVVAARGLVLLQTPTGNVTLNNSTMVLDLHSPGGAAITAYNLEPGVTAPLLHLLVWRSWSPPNPAALSWSTLIASLITLGVASRSSREEQSSLIGEEGEE